VENFLYRDLSGVLPQALWRDIIDANKNAIAPLCGIDSEGLSV
jgi:hypothetical protein